MIPSFLEITAEVTKAKDHLVSELISGNRVKPTATFYRIDIPLFTLVFPIVETIEEREQTFAQAAWVNSTLGADNILFAIDSALPLASLTGEIYNQDVFLLFFASKQGAFVDPQAYIHSKDDNSIEWVTKQIKEDEIMRSQDRLVTFLASQFFLSEHVLPWNAYVKFLESKGFEFIFHPPFEKNLIQFVQTFLHV